jgi:hypothetical protein
MRGSVVKPIWLLTTTCIVPPLQDTKSVQTKRVFKSPRGPAVVAQLAEAHGLVHHALRDTISHTNIRMPNFTTEFVLYYLARESGVAVQDDRHGVALGRVLGVELPGDSFAFNDGVDDLLGI